MILRLLVVCLLVSLCQANYHNKEKKHCTQSEENDGTAANVPWIAGQPLANTGWNDKVEFQNDEGGGGKSSHSAYASLDASSDMTKWLVGWDYGFSAASTEAPDDHSVTGIKLKVWLECTDDLEVVIPAGGLKLIVPPSSGATNGVATYIQTNTPMLPQTFPFAIPNGNDNAQDFDFGGEFSLWGISPSITTPQVRATKFGVAIAFKRTAGSGQIRISYVKIKGYFNTAAPSSAAPTSPAPTSLSPTSGTPTSNQPTSGAPTTGTPTSVSPTSKSPTSKSPTSKSPTSKVPTSKSPTSKRPTSKSPTSKKPTSKSPTSAMPTSKNPTSRSPTSRAPTRSPGPTSISPTSLSPTSKSPSSAVPTSDAPSSAVPTSSVPTSDSPSSAVPTSDVPTSASPTSAVPTSGNPTSLSPTSNRPTSGQPTSKQPTSLAPTSLAPTSLAPTILLSTPAFIAGTTIGIAVGVGLVVLIIIIIVSKYLHWKYGQFKVDGAQTYAEYEAQKELDDL